jgi:LacI family transcriptional regulator
MRASSSKSTPVPSKPRHVLVAITDSHHGFLKGVARYAKEHHWHLSAEMIYTAKLPIGWQGDGIISFVGYRNDLAEFILQSGLPAVEISFLRKDLPLPKVGGDDKRIGELAAEHFLERGYRHYAWAPFTNNASNAERYEGFCEALAHAGHVPHTFPRLDSVEDRSKQCDWAARRRKMVAELKRLPKPLAVFAYNDCIAADILYVCDDAEIPVPESVAVLGVDNDPTFCELPRVPISSICHDLEGMAYESAALLDRIMDGQEAPKENLRVSPRGLVTRRSTDILAVENLAVARALRTIGDLFADPLLDVGTIAHSSGVSRRTLEKAFRRELNRSINEEIVRLRLAKTQELLSSTDLTVAEIGMAAGFSRPSHLYRLFKKHFATSPKRRGKSPAT